MRPGSGVLHPPFPSHLAASSARAAPFSGERPSPSARTARWLRQKKCLPRLFARAAALLPAVAFCALTPPFARFALPHCALPLPRPFSTEIRPPASARAATDLGICGVFSQARFRLPPPSGAAPFPATFRRSDSPASAHLAPAKTIVMYFSAPARRAAAEPTQTVSFFCLQPLSETVQNALFAETSQKDYASCLDETCAT